MEEEDDLSGILDKCLNKGTRDNWELFFYRAQPVVAASVIRSISNSVSMNRQLADDLIQETFLKLCASDFRILRKFRAHDSNALHVYLKAVAVSTVLDHFRAESAIKKGSGRADASLDDVAAELGADDKSFERLEDTLMLDRVTTCLSSQEVRIRRVFWLYHRQGLTPKDIAALPGIDLGPAGVETAIYRLTRLVRECLRKAGFLQPGVFREGGRA
jgi:RNA polymerase sigma-70 factor (ECF subfamily)